MSKINEGQYYFQVLITKIEHNEENDQNVSFSK